MNKRSYTGEREDFELDGPKSMREKNKTNVLAVDDDDELDGDIRDEEKRDQQTDIHASHFKSKSKAKLFNIEPLSNRDPAKTDLKKSKTKLKKITDSLIESAHDNDIYGSNRKGLPPTSPTSKRPPTSPSLTQKAKGHKSRIS